MWFIWVSKLRNNNLIKREIIFYFGVEFAVILLVMLLTCEIELCNSINLKTNCRKTTSESVNYMFFYENVWWNVWRKKKNRQFFKDILCNNPSVVSWWMCVFNLEKFFLLFLQVNKIYASSVVWKCKIITNFWTLEKSVSILWFLLENQHF